MNKHRGEYETQNLYNKIHLYCFFTAPLTVTFLTLLELSDHRTAYVAAPTQEKPISNHFTVIDWVLGTKKKRAYSVGTATWAPPCALVTSAGARPTQAASLFVNLYS